MVQLRPALFTAVVLTVLTALFAPVPTLSAEAAAVDAHLVAPPTETSEPAAPAAAAVTVNVVNFRFDPPVVVVPVGTTVTWVQTSNMLHTVTRTAGTTSDAFTTSLGPTTFCGGPGQNPCSFSYTFNDEGVIAYHCIPHSTLMGMRGVVIVTE